jgi:site-specific DNA-methyltransferase (adenine-specific)
MSTFKITQGKAEEVLATLPDKSIQACVTSPPYWQLRDYGVADQLGTEPTPELYVEKLAAIFDSVRRVLRDDGTLWLNLGDSFCGGGGYCPTAPSNQAGSKQSGSKGTKAAKRPIPPGYKAKDLVGLPWMVALELRKRGWYLRCDCVWEKTCCMPEKLSDRPTRNHEYIFLLSKSKRYYYDASAVLEEAVGGGLKNRRAIWHMPRGAYRGAHFATFPEELPRICIAASTKEGDSVLDPFTGSGTTGKVAVELKRYFVGIELNPEYVQLATDRIQEFLNLP